MSQYKKYQIMNTIHESFVTDKKYCKKHQTFSTESTQRKTLLSVHIGNCALLASQRIINVSEGP